LLNVLTRSNQKHYSKAHFLFHTLHEIRGSFRLEFLSWRDYTAAQHHTSGQQIQHEFPYQSVFRDCHLIGYKYDVPHYGLD
jgi:hypothetical protein